MLTNNFILLLIYLLFGTYSNTDSGKITLTVDIHGLESDKGEIICNLHNDENTFPKKKLTYKIVPIRHNKARAIFKGLEKGNYAVTVVHDKNSNGKLDFNFLHIPIEKTAASNDAKGFFGPPKYKDAKILIDRDLRISINIY